MATKRYYWLKLKENFFKEKAIKKLRKIAGGDTYTIIYLKMLLLSLQNEGKIYFDEIEDDFAEEIALEIDEEAENVKVTIMFLEKCGLLTRESEEIMYLNGIEEMIGSETSSAARVRKHRNNALQSNTQALQCNTEVTQGNKNVTTEKEKDIEKELEKEKEKEKEKVLPKGNNKKKSSKTPKTPQVYYPEDELLNKAFLDFIEMRKQIKKPMTDRAIEIAMDKLKKLATSSTSFSESMDNDLAIQILEQSTLNCWQDIYPLKQEKQQKNNNNNNVFDDWSKA